MALTTQPRTAPWPTTWSAKGYLSGTRGRRAGGRRRPHRVVVHRAAGRRRRREPGRSGIRPGRAHRPPQRAARPAAAARPRSTLVGAELAAEVAACRSPWTTPAWCVAFLAAVAGHARAAGAGRPDVVPVAAEPDALRERAARGLRPGRRRGRRLQPTRRSPASVPYPGRRRSPRSGPACPSHLDELLEPPARAGRLGPPPLRRSAPEIRVHGALRPLEGFDVLDGETIEQLVFAVIDAEAAGRSSRISSSTRRYSMPGRSRFRMNVFRQRGSRRRGAPGHPVQDPRLRHARPAAGREELRRPAPRPRARHRPDRLGQVDDAGLAARHHQPHQGRSTSSRARTRSSSSTRTSRRSSTSARSARTPTRSARPSSGPCARTPT